MRTKLWGNFLTGEVLQTKRGRIFAYLTFKRFYKQTKWADVKRYGKN